MKRFFLIDTFTGLNKTYRPHSYVSEDYLYKYSHVRYVRWMEIQFHIHENHFYFGNKISVPILMIEYGYIDTRDYRWSTNLDVDFEFRVTFTKKFELNIFFHVSFDILIMVSQ